jgi:hypothetical protein
MPFSAARGGLDAALSRRRLRRPRTWRHGAPPVLASCCCAFEAPLCIAGSSSLSILRRVPPQFRHTLAPYAAASRASPCCSHVPRAACRGCRLIDGRAQPQRKSPGARALSPGAAAPQQLHLDEQECRPRGRTLCLLADRRAVAYGAAFQVHSLTPALAPSSTRPHISQLLKLVTTLGPEVRCRMQDQLAPQPARCRRCGGGMCGAQRHR